MKNKFVKKADKLRNECLEALDIFSPRCVPSTKRFPCIGFAIDDDCCKYEELIWLNHEWQFVDGRGLLYSVHALPVEELCAIIDRIIEHPNYKRK